MLRTQSYQLFSFLKAGLLSKCSFWWFACCQIFCLSNFCLPGLFTFIFSRDIRYRVSRGRKQWTRCLTVIEHTEFHPSNPSAWLSVKCQESTSNIFLRPVLPWCNLAGWLTITFQDSISPNFSASCFDVAQVFFILSGEDDETDVREFSDSKRKIFRRGYTNGFLMATPRYKTTLLALLLFISCTAKLFSWRYSPDVILCGWLGSKHQLTNP